MASHEVIESRAQAVDIAARPELIVASGRLLGAHITGCPQS